MLALWACGDSDPASTATPQQTTLIFSDLNWNTALLQNAVARTILEKGYGYETASVPGDDHPADGGADRRRNERDDGVLAAECAGHLA